MTDLTKARRIVEIVGDDWIRPGVLMYRYDERGNRWTCRVTYVDDKGVSGILWTPTAVWDMADQWGDWLPDTTDPATWGVLLSLLPDFDEFCRERVSWLRVCEYREPIDALIAVLEARYEHD